MKLKTLLLAALILVGVSGVAYFASAVTPSFEIATNPNPALSGNGVTITPSQVTQNENVQINVEAFDVSGISQVAALIWTTPAYTPSGTIDLYDDGQHNDGLAGDSNFGGTWSVGNNPDGAYSVEVHIKDTLGHESQISDVVYIMVGEGACASNTDCSVSESCCAGSCAANACVSDTDCTDGDPSTNDTCITAGCPAYCQNTAITSCINADGFCPSGCTSANDSDCSDTTAPTVSISDPATDGTQVSGTSYTVIANAADPESGIGRVEFFLDAETVARDVQYFDSPAGSDNYAWVFDLGGVSNGSHTLTAIAHNNASLSTTATRTIEVNNDVTAPVNVSITSPAQLSTFSSSTTISFVVHAEDDTDVSSVAMFSNAGGGPMNTIASSGTSVDVAVPVLGASIALLESPVNRYAMEETHSPLPFIPVAKAATSTGSTGTNTNCTTTTNSYPKVVYAMAYDGQGNATPSALFPMYVTTTSTNCTGTGTTGSSGTTN